MTDVEQVDRWLHQREDEHVEFKEAKRSFDSHELVRYCCALANEGGGHLVLGVSAKLPRKVVGSQAFTNLNKIGSLLLGRLHIRVRAFEIHHPNGRVVVLAVPSRPVGMPLEVNGSYWMRAGESLTGMSPDVLKRIFDEATPDFSAEPCPLATIADLDSGAITDFRRRWARKSRNPHIKSLSDRQLLTDAELASNDKLTNAALILFGTHEALGRLLPQAELVFEYLSSEASGPAQDRLELRSGFFVQPPVAGDRRPKRPPALPGRALCLGHPHLRRGGRSRARS